jgi:hypothetical protein
VVTPRRYTEEVKASRAKNPRRTLVAYGAPLAAYLPRREMPLEEAVVRGLVAARRDPTLVRVLSVVLLKNAAQLDTTSLRRLAKTMRVESELGMMLNLADELGHERRLLEASKGLPPHTGRPRYFPRPLGGAFGRALADKRTPPVAVTWGFRMNMSQEGLQAFVSKHCG